MMISSRGKYALRVIIDLAENAGDGYLPMKDVAARQDISLKYLQNILPAFVQSGLIEGVHGKGGGYRLCRAPEKISVGEVLRLTDGDFAAVTCGEKDAPCKHTADCRTRPLWNQLEKIIDDYLSGVSIADLMKETKKETVL